MQKAAFFFFFKLFFWHSPDVKEKALLPCDKSEVLRARLVLWWHSDPCPAVAITEWEVTVVSEAVSLLAAEMELIIPALRADRGR